MGGSLRRSLVISHTQWSKLFKLKFFGSAELKHKKRYRGKMSKELGFDYKARILNILGRSCRFLLAEGSVGGRGLSRRGASQLG